MAPLPSTMSSIQGPLSQEGEAQKRANPDAEESESTERAAAKGCKNKAFSLPFSVESLISDRVTSRTSYSASDSGLISPSEERAQLSPMALYTDRKLPLESVSNLAVGKRGESEERNEKAQGGWFHTPSYASPPSKWIQNKACLFIMCLLQWS